MKTTPYSIHPAAAQLAYSIVDNGKPGGLASMKQAMRLLDVIMEKAHVDDRWPNPWVRYNKAQREAIENDWDNPIDSTARVTLDLSSREASLLQRMTEEYASEAPTVHAGAIIHILGVLDPDSDEGDEDEEVAPNDA